MEEALQEILSVLKGISAKLDTTNNSLSDLSDKLDNIQGYGTNNSISDVCDKIDATNDSLSEIKDSLSGLRVL